MVIFNQTFSEDKPVIFPSTWNTGRTQLELYEQWKDTWQFIILKNIMEIVSSFLFILLIYAIITALRELYRISQLSDDSREKKEHRKYLKSSFLASIAFITLIWIGIFIILMLQEWTRLVVLKGAIFSIILVIMKKFYKLLRQRKSKRVVTKKLE